MKFLNKIFIIFICNISLFNLGFSEVTLTDKEAEQIYNRLEKDKQIIIQNQKRWEKIRKEKPTIKYETKDGVVYQTITIPVEDDNPLIYETAFDVKEPKKYIPLTLKLVGVIETQSITDFKFGIEVFSLYPMDIPIGLNVLAGIKSSGLSISYNLQKVFKNTGIHVYTGFSYTPPIQPTYGVGISLNF